MPAKLAIPVWGGTFLIQTPMLVDYFSQLVRYPSYTWLPTVLAAVAVALFLWTWDWQLRVPNAAAPLGLTIFGLTLSLGAAVFDFRWLAILGLLFSVAGFLVAQRERAGGRSGSLLFVLPVVLGLVRPPMGGFEWFQSSMSEWITGTACNVLRLVHLPHVQQQAAISLPGMRYYPEMMVHSSLGWPLFVALAMIHSAVFRRSWAIVLFNWCSACAVCFLFHCGVVLSIAYGRSREAVGQENWPLLYVLWGLAAWLTFLSAERGMRGAIAPIADGTEDARQSNPLVVGWNRLFSPSGLVQSQGAELSVSRWKLALVVLGLVGIGSLVAQAARLREQITAEDPGVVAKIWRPDAAMVPSVWMDSEVVDFHHVQSLIRSEWGNHADVWIQYLPERTTELVVAGKSRRWRKLPALYLAKGWDEASPVELVKNAADGKTAFSTATFVRENQHLVLYFAGIGEDGRGIPARASESEKCFMVHLATTFGREPSDLMRATLANEFAVFFQKLLDDYNAGSSK